MRTASVSVLLIIGLGYGVAQSADVNRDERLLMDEIVEVHREREKLYENMHAVWTKTRVEAGKTFVNKIEFWSRKNKYYRFDYVYVSGPSPRHEINRLVVLPDGHAKLLSEFRDKLGAVYRYGTVNEGKNLFTGGLWYCQANKPDHKQIYAVIEDWITGKSEFKSFHITRKNGDVIAVGHTDGVGEDSGIKWRRTEESRLSPIDYRVLEKKYRYEEDSGAWDEYLTTVTYGDQQVDIPLSLIETHKDSDGGAETKSYQLNEFRLAPAPLSVFFVAELASVFDRSGGSGWSRRVLILVIGAICFSIYYRKRKTSHPATDLDSQESQ